jgi:AI-2 transport protein TqsA
VLLLVAVYYGSGVLAPLALALFIIAIVWPLQQRLAVAIASACRPWHHDHCYGRGVARLCMLAALAFGRVGRSLVADASRYHTFRSQVCGPSISIPDGCCVPRDRSPDASTRR